MVDHDHSYKQLFSHPRMVADLLTGFVDQDWIKSLDLDTLEKLNNSYISDDLRERADDVVWRVKFQDQWLYVYLLIEFQSTVDPFMAVRLLTYTGLLYQDLIKSNRLTKKRSLPAVFPIVLYNGTKPWSAAGSISKLLQPIPEGLKAFQPEQHYWLIDESRYSEQELANLENLSAALIRAEIAKSPDQLARVIANLVVWLDKSEQLPLRRAFKEWLSRILLPQKMPGNHFGEVRDLTEIGTMLEENVKNWTKDWIRQGVVQGRAEGIEEGRAEGIEKGRAEGFKEGMGKGEATALKLLLTARFGTLPDWVETRIHNASLPEIEALITGVLHAESLEQLFNQAGE